MGAESDFLQLSERVSGEYNLAMIYIVNYKRNLNDRHIVCKHNYCKKSCNICGYCSVHIATWMLKTVDNIT